VSRHLVDRRKVEPAAAPAKPAEPAEFGRTPRVVAVERDTRATYRVVYRKGRGVRFLGHLDLTNTILRALTAAGVPISYSEGFHPHPRVAFGPPLPLGVAGECELLDMVLTSAADVALDVVNRFLPPDLRLLRAQRLEHKVDSVNSAMLWARLRFAPLSGPMPEAVSAIERFVGSPEVVVTLEKKGQVQQRDIRPLVREIGPVGDDGSFEAVLSAEPGRSCSPWHLIGALTPQHPGPDWLVTRLECLDRDGRAL
jgi:radical SAM-linked protein